MTCYRVNFGNGATGIVCTRGERRRPCLDCQGARHGTVLCDFPLGLTKKTCDRALCEKCVRRWSLTAPVQLDPKYRAKHGQGDLCRIHAGMVEKGWSPAFLVLCTLVRRERAAVLRATTLDQLPVVLTAGAAEAAAYLSRHPEGGPAAARIGFLGAAMASLAASLCAAGDPVAVFNAEHAAREALASAGLTQTPGPSAGTRAAPAAPRS